MDKNLAKKIIDLDLEHADFVGSLPGIPEANFYEALENVFNDAKKLGVEPEYFRERALAIEKRYVREQARILSQHANKCLEQGDYKGYAAFMMLKNRQENFRQTQKSTGKTAVELGKEELFKRMFIVTPVDALENEIVSYALLLALCPPRLEK
jgi:hypothetical protein